MNKKQVDFLIESMKYSITCAYSYDEHLDGISNSLLINEKHEIIDEIFKILKYDENKNVKIGSLLPFYYAINESHWLIKSKFIEAQMINNITHREFNKICDLIIKKAQDSRVGAKAIQAIKEICKKYYDKEFSVKEFYNFLRESFPVEKRDLIYVIFNKLKKEYESSLEK